MKHQDILDMMTVEEKADFVGALHALKRIPSPYDGHLPWYDPPPRRCGTQSSRSSTSSLHLGHTGNRCGSRTGWNLWPQGSSSASTSRLTGSLRPPSQRWPVSRDLL